MWAFSLLFFFLLFRQILLPLQLIVHIKVCLQVLGSTGAYVIEIEQSLLGTPEGAAQKMTNSSRDVTGGVEFEVSGQVALWVMQSLCFDRDISIDSFSKPVECVK